MKKILSLILSLVLLAFSFKSVNNIYSNNKDQSDILEDIKNNNYILDVKKIELNDKKQDIKSVKDINLNSKSLNLSDGTYLIDRGYGWVMGNDASFLDSGFANPGETVKIQRGKMVGTEHSIIAGVGTVFDLKLVKLAVELAYEHTIADETDIAVGFSLKAPSNKNLYVKTYTTYRRFDMIEIKNGSLVGHSSTYEANGTWAKRVIYNTGETVDQNALKEKVTRNVLGEPEAIDIKNSISVKGSDHIKNLDILINSSSNSLELVNRSNTKIHPRFSSNDYFSIKLLNEFGEEKASMKMTGNDYSNDSKFNNFSKVPYNIGDIIAITHEEPFLLNISGTISGIQDKNNKSQRYRITENGLHSLGSNNPLPSAIYKIKQGLDPNYFLATNKYISAMDKPVMSNTHMNKWDESNWLFEYNSSKDAYTIKHIGSDEYITCNNNKIIVKGKPTDNTYYWIVTKHNDGKYSFINLDTNLCFNAPGGMVYKSIAPSKYEGNENQKFILEKR